MLTSGIKLVTLLIAHHKRCKHGSRDECLRNIKIGSKEWTENRPRELCASRGGRPGLPVPNSPYCLCGRKATLNKHCPIELRSCVQVEVDVLGSPSLTVRTVSVDVKQQLKNVGTKFW